MQLEKIQIYLYATTVNVFIVCHKSIRMGLSVYIYIILVAYDNKLILFIYN